MRILRHTALGLLLLAAGEPARSAPALELPASHDALDLRRHVEILQDRTGRLTVRQLADPAGSEAAGFAPEPRMTRPRTNDPFWIRLQIKNPGTEHRQAWIYAQNAMAASFLVWERDDQGRLTDRGDFGYESMTRNEETFESHPLFAIDLPPGATKTWLIRASFTGAPTFMMHAHSRRSLDKFMLTYWAFIALFTGCLGAMIVYNFFLLLRLRDISYLYYLIFAGTMFLAAVVSTGIFDAYGWNWPGFFSTGLSLFFISLVPATAVLFTLEFFRCRETMPRVARLMLAYTGAQLLLSVAVYFGDDALLGPIVDISHVIAIVLIIGTAVSRMAGGYEPARFFLMGWGFFCVTVLYWQAGQNGIIPIDYINANAPVLGNMVEMLLMSLALAHRIKLLERDKLSAEVRAKEGEAHQRLLRVLVHDLSGPMSVITGSTELALIKIGDHPVRTHLKKSYRAALVMADIVQHVRKIESTRSGKDAIELNPVSVKDVFDNTEFIFEQNLRNKGVRLVCRLEEDLEVMAEKTSLCNDVINNVVSNAIKFSNKGDEIVMEARSQGDQVEITVRDHGIGMPEHIREVLFHPSARTTRPGTDREKGTGFGMPLVQNYLNMFGGSIEVQSVEKSDDRPDDHGTTITMTLKAAS